MIYTNIVNQHITPPTPKNFCIVVLLYDDQLESYIKNMNTSDNTIAFVAFTPYGIQKIQWTLSVFARDYYDRIDKLKKLEDYKKSIESSLIDLAIKTFKDNFPTFKYDIK